MLIISSTGYVKTREAVITLLKENKSLTTSEIIDLAVKSSSAKDCKDRVPQVLLILNKKGIVKKILSKEKKGFVWNYIEP